MDGDIAETTTNDLTSIMGSVETNKNDNIDDPPPVVDSVPSSSSDANNAELKLTNKITDDSISSTSDVEDSFLKTKKSNIEDEAELFANECNISYVASEKITENVEDIVTDLENLLGGPSDFSAPIKQKEEVNEEWFDAESTDAYKYGLNKNKNIKDQVESNKNVVEDKKTTVVDNKAEDKNEAIDDDKNIVPEKQTESTTSIKSDSKNIILDGKEDKDFPVDQKVVGESKSQDLRKESEKTKEHQSEENKEDLLKLNDDKNTIKVCSVDQHKCEIDIKESDSEEKTKEKKIDIVSSFGDNEASIDGEPMGPEKFTEDKKTQEKENDQSGEKKTECATFEETTNQTQIEVLATQQESKHLQVEDHSSGVSADDHLTREKKTENSRSEVKAQIEDSVAEEESKALEVEDSSGVSADDHLTLVNKTENSTSEVKAQIEVSAAEEESKALAVEDSRGASGEDHLSAAKKTEISTSKANGSQIEDLATQEESKDLKVEDPSSGEKKTEEFVVKAPTEDVNIKESPITQEHKPEETSSLHEKLHESKTEVMETNNKSKKAANVESTEEIKSTEDMKSKEEMNSTEEIKDSAVLQKIDGSKTTRDNRVKECSEKKEEGSIECSDTEKQVADNSNKDSIEGSSKENLKNECTLMETSGNEDTQEKVEECLDKGSQLQEIQDSNMKTGVPALIKEDSHEDKKESATLEENISIKRGLSEEEAKESSSDSKKLGDSTEENLALGKEDEKRVDTPKRDNLIEEKTEEKEVVIAEKETLEVEVTTSEELGAKDISALTDRTVHNTVEEKIESKETDKNKSDENKDVKPKEIERKEEILAQDVREEKVVNECGDIPMESKEINSTSTEVQNIDTDSKEDEKSTKETEKIIITETTIENLLTDMKSGDKTKIEILPTKETEDLPSHLETDQKVLNEVDETTDVLAKELSKEINIIEENVMKVKADEVPKEPIQEDTRPEIETKVNVTVNEATVTNEPATEHECSKDELKEEPGHKNLEENIQGTEMDKNTEDVKRSDEIITEDLVLEAPENVTEVVIKTSEELAPENMVVEEEKTSDDPSPSNLDNRSSSKIDKHVDNKASQELSHKDIATEEYKLQEVSNLKVSPSIELVTDLETKAPNKLSPEDIATKEEKMSEALQLEVSTHSDEIKITDADNKPSLELSPRGIATQEENMPGIPHLEISSPPSDLVKSSCSKVDEEVTASDITTPQELTPEDITTTEELPELLVTNSSCKIAEKVIEVTALEIKASQEPTPEDITTKEEEMPEVLVKGPSHKIDEKVMDISASDKTSQELTPEDITKKEVPETSVKSSCQIDEKVMEITASDIKASQELTTEEITTKEEVPKVLVETSSCKIDEKVMDVTTSDIKAYQELLPEDITAKVLVKTSSNKPSLELSPKGIVTQEENMPEIPHLEVSSPPSDLVKSLCSKVDEELTASDITAPQELTPEDITTKEELPEVLVTSSSCKIDEKVMEVTASDIKASQELTPEDITTNKEEVPEVLVKISSQKVDEKVMEVTASDIKTSQELTPEDITTKEEEMPQVSGKSSCSKVDENVMPIIVPNIKASLDISPADITEENISKVVHHGVSSSPSDLTQSLITKINEAVITDVDNKITPNPSSKEEKVLSVPEVSSSPSELVESSSGIIEENAMKVTDVVITIPQEALHEDIHTKDKIPHLEVSPSPADVIKCSSSETNENLMEEKADIINESKIVKGENLVEEAADKSSGSANIPVQEIVPDKIIEEIESTDAKVIENTVKDEEPNNKKEDAIKEVEELLDNKESEQEMVIHESAHKPEVNKIEVVKLQETKVIAEIDSSKDENMPEEPQKKQELDEKQIQPNDSSIELLNVQKLVNDGVEPADETSNVAVTPENEETAIVEQEKSEVDQTININENDGVKPPGETNKNPEISQIDTVDENDKLKHEEVGEQDMKTSKEEIFSEEIGTSKNDGPGDAYTVEGNPADNSENKIFENVLPAISVLSTEKISESVKEIAENVEDKHLEADLANATETEIGNKHDIVIVNKMDDVEIDLPKSVAHSSKSIEEEKANEIKDTLKMEVDIVSDTTESTDIDKTAFTEESIAKSVVATNQDEILENEVENIEEKGPSGDLQKSEGSELGNEYENKVNVETNKIIVKNTIATNHPSEEQSFMHVVEIETSAKDKVDVPTNIIESFSEAKNMPTILPSNEQAIKQVTTETDIKSIDETHMETSVDKTAELKLMSESDKQGHEDKYSGKVDTSQVFKNEPVSLKSEDTKVGEVLEEIIKISPIDEVNEEKVQKDDTKAASTSLEKGRSSDEEKTISEIKLTDTVVSTDKTLPLPVKLPGDIKTDEIKPIEDTKSLETNILDDSKPVDEKAVEVQPVGLESAEVLKPKEVKPVTEVVDEEESTRVEKTALASDTKADEKSGELLPTENKLIMESVVEINEVDIKTNEIKPVSANKEEKSKEDITLMEKSDEKAAEVQPVGLKSDEVKPVTEVIDNPEKSAKVEKTANKEENSKEDIKLKENKEDISDEKPVPELVATEVATSTSQIDVKPSDAIAVEVLEKLSKEESTTELKSEEIVLTNIQPEDVKSVKKIKSAKNLRNKLKIQSMEVAESSTDVSTTPKAVSTKLRVEETESKDITSTKTDQSLETNIQSEVTPKGKDSVDEKVVKKAGISEDVSIEERKDVVAVEITKSSKEESTKEVKSEENVADIQPEDVKPVKIRSARNLRNKQKIQPTEVAESSTDVSTSPKAASTKLRVEETESKDISSTRTDQSLETNIQSEVTPKGKDSVDEKVVKKAGISGDVSIEAHKDVVAVEVTKLSKEESTKEVKSAENVENIQPEDVKSVKIIKSARNLRNKQKKQSTEAAESSTYVSTTPKTRKSRVQETESKDITTTKTDQSLETNIQSEVTPKEEDSVDEKVVRKAAISEDISIEEPTDVTVELTKLSKEESTKEVKSVENVEDIQPEDVKPVKIMKSGKNLRNKQKVQSIEVAESSTDLSTTPKTRKSRVEETKSKDVTSTKTDQSLETHIESEVTPKEEVSVDEKVVKKAGISEDISIEEHTDAVAVEVTKLSKEESTKEVKSAEYVEDIQPEDVKPVKIIKSARNLRKRQKIQTEAAESSTDVPTTPKAVSTKSRVEETESKDITSTKTDLSLETNIQSVVTPKEEDSVDENVVKIAGISEDISIEERTDAVAVEVTKLSKGESTKEVKSAENVEDIQPEDVKPVKIIKSARNLRKKHKIQSTEAAESSTDVSTTPKAVSTKSRVEETESKDITSTKTDQSLERNIQSEVTPKEEDSVDEKVVKKAGISEDISIEEHTDVVAVEVTKLSNEESTKDVKSEENVEDVQPEDVKHVKIIKSARKLRNKQKIQSTEAAESSTDVSTSPKAVSTKPRVEETESKDITSTKTDQSLETNIQSEVSPKEKDSVDENVVKEADISEDVSIEERKVALKRTRAEKKAAKSPEMKTQEEVKDIEDIKSAEEKATKEEVKRASKRVKGTDEAETSVEVPPIKVIKSSPEVPKEEPKRMSRRLRGAAIEEIKPLEEIKPVKESPKDESKRVSKRLKAADKSLEEVKVDEPAVSKKPKLITEEIKPDAAKKIDTPPEKRRAAVPKCSKRLEAKRALEKSLNSSSENTDLESDQITIAESSSNNQVTTSSEVETIAIVDTSQEESESGKIEDSTVLEELPDSAEEFESNKNRNSPDVQITEANVEEELVKAALEASFDDDCKLMEDQQEKTDNDSLQKSDEALLKAAEDSLKRSNQQKEELALILAAQESQKRENDALIQAANEAENNRRITRSKEEYKKPLNIVVETHTQEISVVKEAESTTTEDNEPSTTDNKQVEYSSKMSKNSSQLKLTIRKNKTDDSSILKIYDPQDTAPVEISPSESETEVDESPIPKLIIKQSQCSPKILSPLKITIKPVIKPEEQTQKASPKLIIKPIVKPEEDEIKDEKHHSPKITIKPIPKPVEDAERCNSPKITIKPLIKPTEASVSPKIKIKPIVKPEEIKEDPEERIVLKITKGNIPQQKELKKDETEKLAKIKLKFSKEDGQAHIVNEEKGLKRAIEEAETEAKKLRVEPINPPTENISVPETPVKPEIFSSPPPETPKPPEPTQEPSPVVITPAPRKRGRPRKVPLEVREEFKDPKEDDASGESPDGISGRPKRTCRGQSARATLGIKTRKPRGRGRGRGRGSRGSRSGSPSRKKEKITESKLKLLKEAAITAQITDSLENQDVEMKLSHRHLIEDSNDDNNRDGVRFLTKLSDLAMYEEETRMSADSRAQTPAKHVLNLEGVEESQSSMHSSATTESNKLKKGTRLEVPQEPDGFVVQSPEQLAEYYWGGGGPYMLQEQVAQFLGIKSFKRKYPGISRRTVDMQERDFIRESGLASEHMCDLGLTAVNSADILDIMYSDFQFKYEEYCKHQRDRQTKEISNKQKALSLAASQEKTKLDITQAAVESAAQWNANFNKTRKEERIACMDLQTFTINYPKGRAKQLNRPKIGNYPIALVPGQYTDYYKGYTATELNNMPLNTMLYKPINVANDEDSQSDGSGSESDSSSSGSDSSDSDSSDEDCNICSPGSAVASKKAVV